MKIIKKLLRIVKPGPSKGRNSLNRGQPRRLMTFREHVSVLRRQFIVPQNRAPVPTWADSLNWLKAVA